jgi:hypothetical protein
MPFVCAESSSIAPDIHDLLSKRNRIKTYSTSGAFNLTVALLIDQFITQSSSYGEVISTAK